VFYGFLESQKIGSLQVYTGYLTFSLKKTWATMKLPCRNNFFLYNGEREGIRTLVAEELPTFSIKRFNSQNVLNFNDTRPWPLKNSFVAHKLTRPHVTRSYLDAVVTDIAHKQNHNVPTSGSLRTPWPIIRRCGP